MALASQKTAKFDTDRTALPAAASLRPDYLRPVPATTAEDSVGAELQRFGTVLKLGRGRTLVDEGQSAEYIFKVVTGALRSVRLLPDGRRHITEFLLAGDFVGFAASDAYTDTIETLTETTLVRYSRVGFEALLERDARAGCLFYGLMSKELCAAQERLLMLGRKSALERMAAFLLKIAERTATDANGTMVDLPMNRTDIADYLGLTIETVSRLLASLRTRKVIDVPSSSRVALLQPQTLRTISEGRA